MDIKWKTFTFRISRCKVNTTKDFLKDILHLRCR